MDVKCEKCQARYRIDDARVGPTGLTMRCGKCGNTFKVTRGGGTQAVGANPSAPPPAGKPAPGKPALNPDEAAGRTMMFGVAPVQPSSPPPAAKPAPAAGKPGPAAAKPAPAAENAGATMMFGVAPPAAKPAPAKSAPPTAAKPPPGKPGPQDDAAATMMFAAGPVVAQKADASKAAAKAAPQAAVTPHEESGSTMMFGQSPLAPPKPAPQKAPEAPPPAAVAQPEPEPEEETQPVATADEPLPEQEPEVEPPHQPHGEEVAPRKVEPVAPMQRGEEPQWEGDQGIVAEGAEQLEQTGGELVPKKQSKLPVVPIAIAAATVVVIVLALVAWKKLGKQAPPPAALTQMKTAHETAEKDTPSDYATAEQQANGALNVKKGAFFPVGYAELAEIEIGWADALRDAEAGPADIKQHQSAAIEAIQKGIKQDPGNLDLVIAYADYYRSTKSGSRYNQQIKKATQLAANDPRVAMVQGFYFAGEDDGAEKAVPLLKAAAEALPKNARVRYRYAVALAANKQDADAAKELEAVLQISPGHARAKALLDQEKAKLPSSPAPDAAAGSGSASGKK